MAALEQENSSGATKTGLEMRPATQLLTYGLRTVLGKKHTVQTVKKTSGVDSTSSRMTSHSVTPAVLDRQVQERVDERDAVPSVQQDVVAANAADDAGRRTWTQAKAVDERKYIEIVDTILTNTQGPFQGKANATARAKGSGAQAKD